MPVTPVVITECVDCDAAGLQDYQTVQENARAAARSAARRFISLAPVQEFLAFLGRGRPAPSTRWGI